MIDKVNLSARDSAKRIFINPLLDILNKIDFNQYKVIFRGNNKFLLQSKNLLNFIIIDNHGLNLYRSIKHPKQLKGKYKFFQKIISSSPESMELLAKQAKIISQKKEDFRLPKRKGLILEIFLTMKCNFRCSYCYRNAGNPLRGEMNKNGWLKFSEAIERVIKKNIIDGSHVEVNFNGGEPLLSLAFPELVHRFIRMGAIVRIYSNGSRTEIIKSLGNDIMLLGSAQISLHISNSTYFEKKGLPSRYLLKTFETMNYLINKDVPVKAVVVVSAKNFDIICRDLLCLLSKYILEPAKVEISLQLPYLQGRCLETDLPQSRYSRVYIRRSLMKLKHELLKAGYKNCGIIFPATKHYPIALTGKDCNFGHQIKIWPDGNVSACNVPMLGLNAKRDSFESILNEGFSYQNRYAADKSTICKNCTLRYACGGGCRSQNYLFYGGILRHRCPIYFRKKVKNMLHERLSSIFYAKRQ